MLPALTEGMGCNLSLVARMAKILSWDNLKALGSQWPVTVEGLRKYLVGVVDDGEHARIS